MARQALIKVEIPIDKRSGMLAMPFGIQQYNACNEPCDMLIGYCCCGAHHDWDYWPVAMQAYILRRYLQEERDVQRVSMSKVRRKIRNRSRASQPSTLSKNV